MLCADCIRYGAVLSELLLSVRKIEESLLKLKRGRKTADVANTAATDEGKIRSQVHLDVIEWGAQVSIIIASYAIYYHD